MVLVLNEPDSTRRRRRQEKVLHFFIVRLSVQNVTAARVERIWVSCRISPASGKQFAWGLKHFSQRDYGMKTTIPSPASRSREGKLLRLDQILHERVIGQDETVQAPLNPQP